MFATKAENWAISNPSPIVACGWTPPTKTTFSVTPSPPKKNGELPTSINRGGYFSTSIGKKKQKKTFLPNGGEFTGDESHGSLESVKNHLKNKKKVYHLLSFYLHPIGLISRQRWIITVSFLYTNMLETTTHSADMPDIAPQNQGDDSHVRSKRQLWNMSPCKSLKWGNCLCKFRPVKTNMTCWKIHPIFNRIPTSSFMVEKSC